MDGFGRVDVCDFNELAAFWGRCEADDGVLEVHFEVGEEIVCLCLIHYLEQ